MTAEQHVVIAGAGALGMACADHLTARDGVRVTVVDKAFPGSGSSGLSGGVFTRQYVERDALEIRVRAVQLLEGYERELGFDLHRIGFVRLARDQATLDGFATSIAIQHELGVTESRVVDVDRLRAILPDLRTDGVLGAAYCPTDGYMDGAQLCTLLAERFQARGGTLRVRSAVRGIKRGGPRRYLVEVEGGEEIPADLVVNAGGAWGGQIGAALEAPIEVVNERHEAYTFQLPPGVDYTVPTLLDYVPGSGGEGLYFRQEGRSQLVVGLHSNEILGDEVPDPDDYYRGVSQDQVDVVIEQLAAMLPTLEEIGYQGGWSGLYPHSPDQRLAIGPHPANPHVLVGTGLGGIGLSMASALGEILADWVTHGEPVALPWAAKLAPTA